MIELPEAIVTAREMTDELKGKRIASAVRGNAPHKFAFYTRTPEEYAEILRGKTTGSAVARGSAILASVEPDYVLVLGNGGERIGYHRSDVTLPTKHQLLLSFEDGTYLSVTVQGWGAVQLFHHSEVESDPHLGVQRVSPLSDEFTFEHFEGLFSQLEPLDRRSVKYFLISGPGVSGIGNGYLQDILFRARIHPKKRAVDLDAKGRVLLYLNIRDTLQQAVELGGRSSEHDLYNWPGSYTPLMSSATVGRPCSRCGAPIQKIAYLGGACYFCPSCQV